MHYKESRQLWIERVTDEHGKVHEISAKTKQALSQKLFLWKEKVDNGPTFEEVADAWEEFHERSVEGTTGAAYGPHLKRAKEYFSGYYIKDVTPDRIQSFIDYCASQGYAKDTVRRTKTVLNMVFKYAIVQPGSKLLYNPCSAVTVPKGLSKTRREPPEDGQLKKVKPDCEMGLFAYMIYYTGLRDGELLGLRWEDIDMKAKVIHVRRVATYEKNKAEIKERAKTAAGIRTIQMPDKLVAVLPEGREGFVFGGEEPLTHTAFRKRWIAWCRQIGEVEEEVYTHRGKNGHLYTRTRYKPKITPYQFRHEYATLLEEAGVSEFDAKEAMGHSSIVVTKDIYTHIKNRKHKSELAEKLNAHILSQGESQ